MLSAIALILLIQVGYAAGVTLAAGRRHATPRLGDLLLVALLWVAAFAVRPQLGRWLSLAVWTAAALALSALVNLPRFAQAPVAAPPAPLPPGLSFGRRLWEHWKRFALRMGDYQGRMLVAFFYFVVVTPFGLLARAVSDPLQLRPPQQDSTWQGRPPPDRTVEEARQQG
jgi:hypothetical protein